MTEPEHLEAFGQGLHVHHIIPFIEHDTHAEANQLENLITLCRDCHVKLEGLPIEAQQS